LVEAVDVDAEHARLTRVCEEKEKAAARYRSKLDNKGYLSKAPAAVVEQEKQRLLSHQAKVENLQFQIQRLKYPDASQ
ncbi:MAG: hypothetical protein IIC63_03080, partial [Proteobacteria bacterium]|nr:hypothetical protein [Pseudomonadota bacterium]